MSGDPCPSPAPSPVQPSVRPWDPAPISIPTASPALGPPQCTPVSPAMGPYKYPKPTSLLGFRSVPPWDPPSLHHSPLPSAPGSPGHPSPAVPQPQCLQPRQPPMAQPQQIPLCPPPRVPPAWGCPPRSGMPPLPQGPSPSAHGCSAPQGQALCPTAVRVLTATHNPRKAHPALGPLEPGLRPVLTARTGLLREGLCP